MTFFLGESSRRHYHKHTHTGTHVPPPPPAPCFSARGALTLQKLRNVLQLGDVIFAEATVLFQKREDVVVLVASVGFIQGLQVLVHRAPCFLFLLRVLHSRDGLPTRTQARDVGLRRGRCTVVGAGDVSRVCELPPPRHQWIPQVV